MRDLDDLQPSLKWKVFTSRRPGLSRGMPPGADPGLMWIANSATLIYGERDAVLVDTFLTIAQNRALVDAIVFNQRDLTTIYVTHAHGDHFFGLAPVLERFPQARAVALPQVVRGMARQVAPEYLARFWRTAFPGQIPERTPIADVLDADAIDLEGHRLVPIALGSTDAPSSTCLHVPSIDLVVAGDAVYNGTHLHLTDSTLQSRRTWLSALDTIDMLEPRYVIAGHKVPEGDDGPRHVDETRRYLRDFMRLDDVTMTARELFEAMLGRYPNRANPGALWSAAQAVKRVRRPQPAAAAMI
ncbi:MAG TPA: MBL fold metallo-hydrolase [Kofleriaceae bacterium]|nr:MBL fold metallo-hydrolase [Kofleriaceae bacterium]